MDDKRKAYQQEYRQRYKLESKRVNLTLNNVEYKAFKRSAKQANEKKVTKHIKDLALSGLNNQPILPEDLKAELQTIRFAIYNIANNVNQIAHYSNTMRSLVQSDENNLLSYLKQLDEAVRSYTEGRILNKENEPW